MSTYYTVLTDTGQAKLANATALGQTVELTAIAVGDGGGATPVPDSGVDALVNQQRSAAINQVSVDPDNDNYIICEQVIPEDVGGWWIREVGIFDTDGDLLAYGNFPETYKPQLEEGSGRTQTIRVVIMVSDTAAITLKIDPAVVLATRQYVDSELADHAASRNHPTATTTYKGFVEKATKAEAKAGATDKYPDASGMRSAIDDGMAYQKRAVFDSAGTTSWAVPQELTNGRRKAFVTVIGGGGGGGAGSGSPPSGGGGGGGGIASGYVDLTGTTSVSITVGAGGAGVTSGDGQAGESSSFGTYISASGGDSYVNAGGQAGLGSGGDYNSSLGPGGPRGEEGVVTGSGGGPGGPGLAFGQDEGRDAVGPGGGGGGSKNGALSGSGSDGLVIVRW